MGKRFKRTRYFIHPSSQLKYITMSVLPALVIAIFCLEVFFRSEQQIVKKMEETVLTQVNGFNSSTAGTIQWLVQKKYPQELVEKVTGLLKEISFLQETFQRSFFGIIGKGAKTKAVILIAVVLILIFIGILAVILSHRIAGSIYRLRKDIDMLTEGRDIPPVRLRKNDEFKELAASLEKLRISLKEKGFLRL